MKPTIFAPVLISAAVAACSSTVSPTNDPPAPSYSTFTAQGDSLTIAAKLGAFRTALGGSLNAPNSPPAASGRREINWDGVPAALTNVDTFPLKFFNVNSKRGVEYRITGTGLRVDSTSFRSFNPALGDQFKPFSGKKLFTPVGSNQVSVDFKLAGAPTAGLVNGFGVVFSDVDQVGSTRIELFDGAGVRIALLQAAASPGSHGFSFIGAVFASPVVASARITSGDAALDGTTTDVSAGGTKDLVAMDDFVYGEPQPVPHP
jgi:hypothetical protein